MGEPAPIIPRSSPTSRSARIDDECDRFEASWRAGKSLRIEEYLASAPQEDHPILLRELVAIERELREREGECPDIREYLIRFPEDAEVIRAALRSSSIAYNRPTPPSRDQTGRNLMFGLLALQNNFISRDELVAAFGVWIADKTKPLADTLLSIGKINDRRHGLLDALVSEQIELHGGDLESSLQAFAPADAVREDLRRLGDPDLEASLSSRALQPDKLDDDATPIYIPASSHRTMGRFRILRFHREGGLGRVYIARDCELERDVALKEIRPDKADADNFQDRFNREAKISGSLEHPGIVPIYSLGKYENGQPFYAMRFVEGNSFREEIRSFHKNCPTPDPGGIHARKLLGRFLAVCDAIAFAHAKGVLHRDLKPQNIMLGPYGETLLIDWGLARATGRREPSGPASAGENTLVLSSDSGGTPTVGAIGTPRYMSPEQAAGEVESLGATTDIYALGAILCTILSGEPPVEKGTQDEEFDRALRGEIRTPRSLNPNIPRSLEAVCLKALALKPEQRYPTALALAGDIECWLADMPVTAYRDHWMVHARRWLVRHTTLTVAAIMILIMVALGSLAGAFYLRSRAWYEGKARFEADRAPLEVFAGDGALDYLFHNSKDAVRTYDTLVRRGEERAASEYATDVDRILLGKSYLYRGLIEAPGVSPQVAKGGSGALFGELLQPGGDPSRFFQAMRELNDVTRLKPTLQWFDKAVAAFDSVIAPDRLDAGERHLRASCYRGRSAILMKLDRHTEALVDLDRFLALVGRKPNLSELLTRVLLLMAATAEQSKLPWSHGPGTDHVKATRMADILAEHEGVSPDAVYNAACVFSLASADEKANPDERRRRAGRALLYLKRIAEKGHFRDKKPKEKLQEDQDLDPIRHMNEFRDLLRSVINNT